MIEVAPSLSVRIFPSPIQTVSIVGSSPTERMPMMSPMDPPNCICETLS